MTNAARRPNASRANTYFPPACGYRVESSAKIDAPRKPTAPPRAQATKVRPGRPRSAATVPGVRKMPEPTMMPTTTASPSPVRKVRSSRGTGCSIVALPAIDKCGEVPSGRFRRSGWHRELRMVSPDLNDAPPAPATVSRGPGRALIPLGAALCFAPFMSTGLGLLLGLALALSVGNPYLARTRKVTSTLLALAVVGLGAGMDLRVVARVGAHGILYTLTGIVTALALAAVLARVLRVDRNTGILIGVGTAICGGSAIAAIVPVLKPREHEVSVALGTVFLLNAVALFIFPPIGRLAHLSDAQFGLWSALAIHDTSSVVGAAGAAGGQAVPTATTRKVRRRP